VGEYLRVFGHVVFFTAGGAPPVATNTDEAIGVQELLLVGVGGNDGIHRLRKASLLEAGEEDPKLGVEDDAEVPIQQLEWLERIRVAAGQTS